MEKHKCKYCSRIFGNGRALGGHIRSHMVKSQTKSRTNNIGDVAEPIISSSSSDSVILHDQSTESQKRSNLSHTQRSKSVKKSRILESDVVEVENTSCSVSETEDVAYCLMMLSKDKWIRDDDVEEEVKGVSLQIVKKKGLKYKCEDCRKVFRSYQALGGHRASHKKMKRVGEENGNNGNVGGSVKIHQCPICFRVFSSGQALGGHKRSHFADSSSVSTSFLFSPPEEACSTTSKTTLIDLNLPAPMDDDDADDDDEDDNDDDDLSFLC